MSSLRSLRPLCLRVPCALGLAAAMACSPDSPATGPEFPTAPPDLAESAYELRIDVASGRITVTAPPALVRVVPATGSTMANSLLGRDAVRLHPTDCSFSVIPNNSKQKRCTLNLAIENLLQFTDLVTPTTFPRPPQGTTGLLVFPYT
ncbi:MAG: hypothetical protein ACREM9_13065, partial [Gemmatimonadales bacterium]